MKILLIGERYSNNLGDPVICQTVRNIILQYDTNAMIEELDLSGRIFFDKKFHMGGSLSSIILAICVFLRNTDICIREITKRSTLGRYLRTLCMLEIKLSRCEYDVILFAGGHFFRTVLLT